MQIVLPVLVVLLGARAPPYPKTLNPCNLEFCCERSVRPLQRVRVGRADRTLLPVLVVLLGARAPPYPKSPEP